MLQFRAGVGLILLMLCAVPAWGADQGGAVVPYTLGEVVVTGSEVPAAEKVTALYTVTAEEITKSGARDLADALRLVPGVQIRRAPKGVRVDIRGLRTRHVRMLVNGIPVSETYDGQFDPRIIATENIALIKVMPGASSVLYGAGGMGGTINIITRKGGETYAHLSAEAGLTHNEHNIRFGAGATAGKANLFVSGAKSGSEGFPMSSGFDAVDKDVEGGNVRQHSSSNSESVYVNVGYDPAEETSLGLTMNYTRAQWDDSPAANAGEDGAKDPKYDSHEIPDEFMMQVAAKHQFSKMAGLKGWGFASRQGLEEDSYADEKHKTIAGSTDGESRRIGGGLAGTLNFESAGQLVVSAQGEKSTWQAETAKYSKKKGTSFTDTDESITVGSLAAEYTLSPVKGLDLTAGIGGHKASWEGESTSDVSAMLGAQYAVCDYLTVRGSAARLIRFPSLKQLYDASSGNDELDAERSMQQEIGFDVFLPADTSLHMTGFHNEVTDYIEKSETSDLYENNEKYRFLGLETVLENRSVDDLVVSLGYSLLESRNLSDNRLGDRLQNRPRHKFTGTVEYSFTFGLRARFAAMYAADVIGYNDNGDRERMPDYLRCDLSLLQRVTDNVDLTLRMNNMLDADYEQSLGQPDAGREIFAGIDITF